MADDPTFSRIGADLYVDANISFIQVYMIIGLILSCRYGCQTLDAKSKWMSLQIKGVNKLISGHPYMLLLQLLGYIVLFRS